MTLDTTPHPRFLRGLQNQKWTAAGALAELVDNSFGPARGDADEVHITYATKDRMLTVLDDGRGMDAVGHLFKLGETVGMRPNDIGMYGNGGKLALLYLASWVRITTLRKGYVNCSDKLVWARVFEGEGFPQISTDWRKATLSNTPKSLLAAGHGTLIEIKLLPERRLQLSNVQRDLARMYAPAARRGKRLRWTTIGKNGDSRVLDEQPEMPNDPDRLVHIDLTLEVRGEMLGVRGAIGLIEGLPYSRSHVAVGFGGRVVDRTRDCYRSADEDERYTGTGVGGWLDLGDGWQPYLSTTKDAMNDRPAWDVLMHHVFTRIRHLLKGVDEREMWAEFDDLALQLQGALSRGGHKVDVEVFAESGEETEIHREEADGSSGPPGPPSEGKDDRRVDPDAGNSPTHKPENKGAKIEIIRLSDAEIGGVLCKNIDIGGDVLGLAVNQDHEYVQQALNPPNRLAFNGLITREIAEALAHDEPLLRSAFPPRVRTKLPEDDGTGARAQVIHRLLMDRVRTESKVAA